MPKRYCGISGCGREHSGRGWCKHHYHNWYHRGDPLAVGRIGREPAHGRTFTVEYFAWHSMKLRCYLKTRKDYHRYGGRGIRVCKRWLNSFENFFADMGEKPTPQHSLDRYPNKDGNYEPSNCRWATAKEQCRNTSRNVIIEFQGTSLTLVEWAERLKRDRTTIAWRLKNGFSVEESLFGKLKYSQAEARKRAA